MARITGSGEDPLDRVERPWATFSAAPISNDPFPKIVGELRKLLATPRNPFRRSTFPPKSIEVCDRQIIVQRRGTQDGAPVVTYDVSPPVWFFGKPTVRINISLELAKDTSASDGQVVVAAGEWVQDLSAGSIVRRGSDDVFCMETQVYQVAGNEANETIFLTCLAAMMELDAVHLIENGRLLDAIGGTSQFSGLAAPPDFATKGFIKWKRKQFSVFPKPAWSRELSAMPALWRDQGFLAAGDESGARVEFPFAGTLPATFDLRFPRVSAETGYSASTSGTGCRFQQSVLSDHQRYGAGLLSQLTLPLQLDRALVSVLADALNRAEADSLTSFNSWGTWAPVADDDSGRLHLGHRSFLPASLFDQPNIVRGLNQWALDRSRWAQEQLLPLDAVRAVRSGERLPNSSRRGASEGAALSGNNGSKIGNTLTDVAAEAPRLAEEQGASWGYATSADIMYLLPNQTIHELERRHRVLDCSTWGEVAELGDDIHREVLGVAGYGTADEFVAHLLIQGAAPLPNLVGQALDDYDPTATPPTPDDPFDAESLDAYNDGDWPPHPCFLMAQLVPAQLIERFGESYWTTFNGQYANLRSVDIDDILASCSDYGINAEHSASLDDIISTF